MRAGKSILVAAADRVRLLLRDPGQQTAQARRIPTRIDRQAAINRFLDERNQQTKLIIWTANLDKIIAVVRRGHRVLDSIHSHVRRFKLQARIFFCSRSSVSKRPLLQGRRHDHESDG
jgi:hypothetical protein